MKKAFTLAEVLITLGIIGVVSAMTIPTLIHKYKNDEYIAGMKKVYATLSQAVLSAKEQVGLENLGTIDPDRIREQMDCVSTSANIANPLSDWRNRLSDCSLANGMQIRLMNKRTYSSLIYGAAVVDTNGASKQPNEWGRDRWIFLIAQDGRVIPSGAEIRDTEIGSYHGYSDSVVGLNGSYALCSTNTPQWNYGCGGHVLKNNWVIDY